MLQKNYNKIQNKVIGENKDHQLKEKRFFSYPNSPQGRGKERAPLKIMLDFTTLDIIQLGTTGVAIVVIFLVVQKFLEFIKIQERGFTEVIKNHLDDAVKSQTKMERTNDRLITAVQMLLDFLKKNGYSHKRKKS